ncbi:Uncharacterised protein [Enterobacter cloacae]|uniref:Uncharacterized protein n=1 Tax=Enterobacter cloacae TaxID=550 RepID=A0A377M8X2_ENTCL|nr:Uncharacterised protein [Enterobacter cloacae]
MNAVDIQVHVKALCRMLAQFLTKGQIHGQQGFIELIMVQMHAMQIRHFPLMKQKPCQTAAVIAVSTDIPVNTVIAVVIHGRFFTVSLQVVTRITLQHRNVPVHAFTPVQKLMPGQPLIVRMVGAFYAEHINTALIGPVMPAEKTTVQAQLMVIPFADNLPRPVWRVSIRSRQKITHRLSPFSLSRIIRPEIRENRKTANQVNQFRQCTGYAQRGIRPGEQVNHP